MNRKALIPFLFLLVSVSVLEAGEKPENKIVVNVLTPVLQYFQSEEEVFIDFSYEKKIFEMFSVMLPFRIHVAERFDIGMGCGIAWYPRVFPQGPFIRYMPLSDARILRFVDEGNFSWNMALDVGSRFNLLSYLCFEVALGGEVLDITGSEFVLRPYLDISVGLQW